MEGERTKEQASREISFDKHLINQMIEFLSRGELTSEEKTRFQAEWRTRGQRFPSRHSYCDRWAERIYYGWDHYIADAYSMIFLAKESWRSNTMNSTNQSIISRGIWTNESAPFWC